MHYQNCERKKAFGLGDFRLFLRKNNSNPKHFEFFPRDFFVMINDRHINHGLVNSFPAAVFLLFVFPDTTSAQITRTHTHISVSLLMCFTISERFVCRRNEG